MIEAVTITIPQAVGCMVCEPWPPLSNHDHDDNLDDVFIDGDSPNLDEFCSEPFMLDPNDSLLPTSGPTSSSNCCCVPVFLGIGGNPGFLLRLEVVGAAVEVSSFVGEPVAEEGWLDDVDMRFELRFECI